VLRTGVDLLSLERFARVRDRFGERFLNRVFTPLEREQCGHSVQSLAGCFALKEAVSKVLGTGLWRSGVAWQDIEILRDQVTGEPSLRLSDHARAVAEARGVDTWSISLSHDGPWVLAFVVAVRE